MEGSNQKKCGTRLCSIALALALGITWALGILLLGILSWKFNYGTAWLTALSSLYVGYAPTVKGIGIGVIWAFVDGFVGGLIVSWIYNAVARCCPCKACKGSSK